jgi:hypothetical protein
MVKVSWRTYLSARRAPFFQIYRSLTFEPKEKGGRVAMDLTKLVEVNYALRRNNKIWRTYYKNDKLELHASDWKPNAVMGQMHLRLLAGFKPSMKKAAFSFFNDKTGLFEEWEVLRKSFDKKTGLLRLKIGDDLYSIRDSKLISQKTEGLTLHFEGYRFDRADPKIVNWQVSSWKLLATELAAYAGDEYKNTPAGKLLSFFPKKLREKTIAISKLRTRPSLDYGIQVRKFLNTILDKKDFYNKESWEDEKKKPVTKALEIALKKRPKNGFENARERQRFNRILIEAALPKSLVTAVKFNFILRKLPRRLTEEKPVELTRSPKQEFLKLQLGFLAYSFAKYFKENHRYAGDLKTLTKPDSNGKVMLSKAFTRDPWGREFYLRWKKDGTLKLMSYGKDGMPDDEKKPLDIQDFDIGWEHNPLDLLKKQ